MENAAGPRIAKQQPRHLIHVYILKDVGAHFFGGALETGEYFFPGCFCVARGIKLVVVGALRCFGVGRPTLSNSTGRCRCSNKSTIISLLLLAICPYQWKQTTRLTKFVVLSNRRETGNKLYGSSVETCFGRNELWCVFSATRSCAIARKWRI